MAQLYAACRIGGQLVAKFVQLTNQVQGQLDGVFEAQEAAFLDNIVNEIDFTGDWKPDEDELLVLSGLPESQLLLDASNQNAIALPVLDVGNFQAENVRALFTAVDNGPQRRLLVQNFGPQQLFAGRFALLHDGNVFRRITEPAFSLGTQLVATINSAGDIRFKSYPMLRRVLDVTPFFRAATDPELQGFCAHVSFVVADIHSFVDNADEGVRKHVLAVIKANVLAQYDVPTIAAQAAIGFPLGVDNGRIVMPMNRKGAKALLSFLLNKVYQGPLSQQLFITNSNRPLV
jgi:hypothetical protein